MAPECYFGTTGNQMIKALLSFVVILSTCGCEAAFREWQRERLLSHVAKLQSYQGTIVESGILDSNEDLVSEISYQRPGQYATTVIAPDAHSGSKLSYDGTTLQIFYPKTKFAIVYRNLKPLSDADQKSLLEDQFNTNMEMYVYELGKEKQVAGLKTIELKFGPKVPSTGLVSGGSSQIYDEYSFPLAGDLFFGKHRYSYRFKEIKFNEKKNEKGFSFPIPKDTIISDWDLSSPAVPEAEVKSSAGFKFNLPTELPRKMSLSKIIKQKGPIPAFTAIYEKHPYFMNIVFFKNYGFSAAPKGRGIKIQAGPVSGELVPNPHISSFSFIAGDTQYIITGNVSAEAIVATGTSIAKAK